MVDTSQYTEEELVRLQRNGDALVAILRDGGTPRKPGSPRRLGLELERFVIDPVAGARVPYDGAPGISDLLEAWGKFFSSDDAVISEGTLLGYEGTVKASSGREVGVSVSLEPGSQLEVAVGPSPSVCDLLDAVVAFDEQFVAVCDTLGVEWQLVALGVDPLGTDPAQVPLIPKSRYALMDAYLPAKGRYGRDMMRASASTQVSIDYDDGASMVAAYRLAVVLGPVVSFLCDNVSSWRGLSVADTPTMVRSRIWASVDDERCGVVPGTFEEGFGPEAYVRWLMGVQPILFTDDAGLTISTSSATTADILAMRELSQGELLHLLSMVFPTVRLKGFLEIRDADSMPPHLAAGFAAFIKGIFYDEDAFARATELVVDGRVDGDIDEAMATLRESGWDARVYGLPVTTLVARLVQLAENGLHDQAERRIFHGLSSLWQARLTPRDLYRREESGA